MLSTIFFFFILLQLNIKRNNNNKDKIKIWEELFNNQNVILKDENL